MEIVREPNRWGGCCGQDSYVEHLGDSESCVCSMYVYTYAWCLCVHVCMYVCVCCDISYAAVVIEALLIVKMHVAICGHVFI